MNSINNLAVLREVENDDGLGFGAISGVGEGAHGDKDSCDPNHDAQEDPGEFLRVLHGFLYGDDKADTFKGEDCCSDAASHTTKSGFIHHAS